ncbi:flagellar hook-associated protein 1 FlgK [Oribacterium sp. KHPX15]|uniref:flagellar hook-associated protein FlgK n=1 Tax=Oribacterium sp. KHPX15 TaxID=1855342 RepID=UPI00089A4A9D|nr:flagellar basal body protein [Oribacterium sp. KHPX15]SEA42935.1 flagellar hook-associated protein 1 FlgK [Oribacterium sp. KHPX15]
MVRPTFGGFQTALTSLQSNSKKLDVTSQNLANMNVEGYTRQQLKTSSLNYNNPTSYYMNENDVNVGFGVSMDEVVQLRDQFLDIQYRDQNTKYAYNDTTEYSLNTLGSFMDESNMDGIRASLDEVQEALTIMQDTSKVQDPIYEGQLQSTLNATCVLLNSAADKIKTAEDNEFEKLYGEGTSEGGAVEKINDLLREIGDLNKQIKHNQLMGSKALELLDERNLKIDELSSYIPITVESFSETYNVYETVTATDSNGNPIQATDGDGNPLVDGDGNPVYETETKVTERQKIYIYNQTGEIAGRSDWPSDLRISLDYTTTNADGTVNNESIILVNGTYDDANGFNYGKVKLTGADNDPPTYTKWNSTNPATSGTGPLDVQLDFISAATNKKGTQVSAQTIRTANSATTPGNGEVTFSGGSVQAGLDMLAKSDPNGTATSGLKQGTYYGYDYYMDKLDNLAQTLADEMNTYNYMGNTWDYPTQTEAQARADAESAIDGGATDYIMLVNRSTQTGKFDEITAENISLSKKWINGDTKIGLKGADSNQTVLNMLRSFTQPHSELADKTFANYMNSLSTRLANDQYNNKDALDTNKVVLDSITSSKDQLSGVSLDEEAANMMIYVSSYNAAAKIMTAFDETLETLLGIV